MKVSLNWIKKYVDLPETLTPKQIAYDLTLRTVEVEDIQNTAEKFHDIVVGKILQIKAHPNADALKICIVDIGKQEPVQIVCGGSNLYEGELVVVSKPGAEVVWHGEGEPVVIKETKMRGEYSYGMICGAEEVFLDKLFPPEDDHEIVDLKGIACKPGDNICDIICMNDTVIEIDNKSLTNRPDLWGHYGIARELSCIYDVPLKELEKIQIDNTVPKYDVEIVEPNKCQRYIGVEIDNVCPKDSPMWMKSALINCGMRPINAIVDITNYVMLAVGQPTHAFDKTHIKGEKIIVRNAKAGEQLLLLDDNFIDLTEDDLVIADTESALALAGIRGGKKDSILSDTTSVLLEVANFTAKTIRKTGQRFDEKTDSSIRYEKNIDTQRVDLGKDMALILFKELFPESKIVKYNDVYPVKTEMEKIDVEQEFLNVRLGKVLSSEVIIKILKGVGYSVEFDGTVYHVTVPVWRSTGDVSIKDDVMGDIARLLSFESFEAKPLPVNFEHAVNQTKVLLERRVKEYLAYRCGMNEIFTYPWIEDRYIQAAKIDTSNSVRLATPPSPESAFLRSSLVPGMLEAISKNLRYMTSFKIFEMAQVFEQGKYHPSSEFETLPIHKKYLTGAVVGKDAKELFYEAKGIIENMASYCHMESLNFKMGNKPSWADINAYLDIMLDDETIGTLSLVSVQTMADAKIKRSNIAIFELDFGKFIPFTSRTNKFEHLPVLPLVEKDLSLLVDETTTWEDIYYTIKSKAKEVEFIEEYRGSQIPKDKKSIVLRIRLSNDDGMLTSEQINSKVDSLVKSLNNRFGVTVRAE